MKVSILSNINIDAITKRLSRENSNIEVYKNEGYGNIAPLLLDNQSSYNKFNPDITFLLVDLAELTINNDSLFEKYHMIDEILEIFKSVLKPERFYFINNGEYCLESLIEFSKQNQGELLEQYWNEQVKNFVQQNRNILIYPLKALIEKIGRMEFYSSKLWYLGKIRYTVYGEKNLVLLFNQCISLCVEKQKKLLVVDLDNTLWGGVVGEDGCNGIELDDSGKGRIFKDVQRLLKAMKLKGVILAIVSKNNKQDVDEVFQKHPHMILKEDDFICKKINWEHKSKNIAEIAREINIGIDSIVFIDDNPVERKEVTSVLPDVVVPEFPEKIEEYPNFIIDIYNKYFLKLFETAEDKKKTEMYQSNLKREELKKNKSMEDYLKELEIEVVLESLTDDVKKRVYQLIHKTNQFNFTTKRYSLTDIEKIIERGGKFYVFHSKDKYGDNGIIGIILILFEEEFPEIDLFLMSCRVMGRKIENYMLDYVEKDLLNLGYKEVYAQYRKTEKNHPVAECFKEWGYTEIFRNEQVTKYKIELFDRPKRIYTLKGEGVCVD